MRLSPPLLVTVALVALTAALAPPDTRVYRDRDDWWVGYYRGPRDHFVCPLPTLVIRWPRR